MQLARHNMAVITSNPGKQFAPDPNGFLVPREETEADFKAAETRKKQAAAELSRSSGTLFDKLMSMDM